MNQKSSGLKTLYELVSWADFGLVIAVLAYMSGPMGADILPVITIGTDTLPDSTYLFEMLHHAGVLLTLLSLLVTIAAIVIARLLRKQGEITRTRWVVRCITWGIWIPIDLAFLVMAVSNLNN